MWSWHSEVAAVMAHVAAVQRMSAKEWMMKWGSVARGWFSVHSLFNSSIPCWPVSPIPEISGHFTVTVFQSWFQLQSHCLPSPSSHGHQPAITCSIRVPAKILHQHSQPVSLLNSFPLDWHNIGFPMSVMPSSQGPTCHSWNRGCPSWDQGQQPQLAQNEGWFRQSQWKYCRSPYEDRPSPVILDLCPVL